MTATRHFILPALLIGVATAVSVFALFIAGSRGPARKTPQKPALASWEDEGGRVAPTLVSTP